MRIVIKYLNEVGFLGLTLSLVLLLIVPVHWQSDLKNLILGVLISFTLLSYLALVASRRLELIFGILLSIPVLIQTWLSITSPESGPSLILTLCSAFFFAYITVEIGRIMLLRDQVSFDVINAAISVYFLIGITWSYIYLAIEISDPGAILSNSGLAGENIYNQLLYFSFVTLTTLGYGDIVPTTQVGQHWAVLQSILGQFYLAILVARIVSLFGTSGK